MYELHGLTSKSWVLIFSCEEAALEAHMLIVIVCLSPKLNFTFHLLNVNHGVSESQTEYLKTTLQTDNCS